MWWNRWKTVLEAAWHCVIMCNNVQSKRWTMCNKKAWNDYNCVKVCNKSTFLAAPWYLLLHRMRGGTLEKIRFVFYCSNSCQLSSINILLQNLPKYDIQHPCTPLLPHWSSKWRLSELGVGGLGKSHSPKRSSTIHTDKIVGRYCSSGSNSLSW